MSDHFELVHVGRMDRETSFHADAIAHLANDNALGDSTVSGGDDDAFENLNSKLVSFPDLLVDLYGVAWSELGESCLDVRFNHTL